MPNSNALISSPQPPGRPATAWPNTSVRGKFGSGFPPREDVISESAGRGGNGDRGNDCKAVTM